MTGNIPLLCEACEAGYIAGPICPECGTETCAQCGWCDECTSQTVHWPAGPYAGPLAGDDDPYVNDEIGGLT